MIFFIDTSTPICRVWLEDASQELVFHDEWDAGRDLSKDILTYVWGLFQGPDVSWKDVSGIVVYQGPGSFTGLRIGITVMNTVAHSENISIVGETGETWRDTGRQRLMTGKNDQLVMPMYGADANITQPRK